MADLPPDHVGDRGSSGAYPGAPRWVKVFGLVVLALVLLVIVVLLVTGGHGPARHLPPVGAGGHASPAPRVAQQPWR